MNDERQETVYDICQKIRDAGIPELADHILAAWKRERAEIEAQALSIGGIVESSRHKQKPQGNAAEMREEIVLRLSKKEYKGMQEALAEHDRLCEMVGNAAALREALESFMVGSCVYPCVESCGYDPIDEICMRCAASPEKDGDCPYEKARKALAARQRNCDAMPWRKAWDEWRAKHHPQNPQTFNESYEATVAFMEWFIAPAAEKGATA